MITRYFKHSNLQLTVDLNPFQWGLRYTYAGPNNFDPGRHLVQLRVLFLRLTFILDDGSIWQDPMEIVEQE